MDRSPGYLTFVFYIIAFSTPVAALPLAQQNGTAAPSPGSLPGAPGENQGPRNLFGYEASFSMAIAGVVSHIVLTMVMILQLKRTKAWYFWLLAQAALAGVVGTVARTHAILHPGEMTPFVVQKIALSMEPTMACLAIMFTHTRIIWLVTPNDKRSVKTLGVPSNWITCTWGFIFILPDMVKGAISQLGQPKKGEMPNPHSIFHRIEGICGVFQIIAVIAYTFWAANFMRISASWHPHDQIVKRKNWRLLGWIDVAASLLVTLRVIATTLEFDSRYDPKSYLSMHEWMFWMLNMLPPIVIYILYIAVHPGDFLPFAYTRFQFNTKTMAKKKLEEEQMTPITRTNTRSLTSPSEKTQVTTRELFPSSSRV